MEYIWDAFPDYTKFDATHKVLAAIQVITDESGQTEGTREPCEQLTFDATIDNTSTASIESITLNGETLTDTSSVTGIKSGDVIVMTLDTEATVTATGGIVKSTDTAVYQITVNDGATALTISIA